MNRLADTRRILATLLLALWFGGFTFYALVVVPTGHQVLGSKVRQGLITQLVTQRLNALAGVTLAALLWQLVASRGAGGSTGSRRVAWISWAVLAVSLAALVLLHPLMDALLDAPRRVVLDDDRFYSLHRVYLIVSTVQWLAGLVCLIWLLQPPQRR